MGDFISKNDKTIDAISQFVTQAESWQPICLSLDDFDIIK